MKLSLVHTPRLTAVGALIIVVGSGIALTRLCGARSAASPPPSKPSPPARAATVPPEQPERKATAAKGEDSTSNQPLPATPLRPQPAAGRPMPSPSPSSAIRPLAPPPPRRRAATGTLPPFPAPDPGGLRPLGVNLAPPVSNVLWLSGVIDGRPRVALLRKGDSRYLVKEGDTFDGYRVVKVGANSVTIQRGRSKRTLRVGER